LEGVEGAKIDKTLSISQTSGLFGISVPWDKMVFGSGCTLAKSILFITNRNPGNLHAFTFKREKKNKSSLATTDATGKESGGRTEDILI